MIHRQAGDQSTGCIELPRAYAPKAVTLQAADLFGCGESFLLSPFQTVDEKRGKPSIFHGIGQDAAILKESKLFFRRRPISHGKVGA